MEKEIKEIKYIRIEDIIPNRFQPRIAFDENELNDLASSIERYGIIQPLVVRPISDKYEIIAGERRYKASTIAGLKTVPCIVKTTDDDTSAEIALLENLQRKNLTPIEEAQSYKKLINRGFTQEDIAVKLNVSQGTVANKLRLLNLPFEVQDALLYNKISERHARSLLALNNEEKEKELLDKIINNRLTVKQTEDEINQIINNKSLESSNNMYNNEEKINSIITNKTIKDDSETDYFNNNDIIDIDTKLDNMSPFTFVPSINEEDRKIDDIEFKNSELKTYEQEVNVQNDNLSNNNIYDEEISRNNNSYQSKNIFLDDDMIIPDADNISYNDYYENENKSLDEKYNKLDMDIIKDQLNDLLISLGLTKDMFNLYEVDLLNKHQITIDIKKN